MKNPIRFSLLIAALALFAGAAGAQEQTTAPVIDARVVRVKLDGVIDLRLRQGDQPSVHITGEKRYVDKVKVVQNGDTLLLDTESRGMKWSRSTVRADVVLPQLRELVSEGVGTMEVSGFKGEEIELTLDGAGSMKVVCDYRRLKANLGGVGSMHLWVAENDAVDLELGGAGYVTLGGRSKMLRANLGGLGGLNAQQFQADSVEVELSGLGNATVNARTNANLNLSGLGSVTVYGKPLNRNVSVDGLGKVSWK
ncbi:GIN domain-containing protein [Massilia endophytica]|uniref:GIN domain-containing protein n=1 Tax=Massilia endophytica TaxID=2899220 RepID=UPI001E2F12B1|nr:DUF2807 domain-containing protein [Massilia endophytica]UGQ44772.1 DUF2807 domain-containing protein [Massilia endophytica]